ncbi:TPA: 16S rRNA (guanine(966)-N(2))-methyltransferase RsmD, partial [candidate division WOR-3]|nr:16S rRNA (guanine(966)-N(2))-methyltransferase RsmD [candidate division WOR-3 bacterium]
DLIFVDPPYRLTNIYKPLKLLSEKNILKKDGFIVNLSYLSEVVDVGNFKIFKEKSFGITRILFLKEL